MRRYGIPVRINSASEVKINIKSLGKKQASTKNRKDTIMDIFMPIPMIFSMVLVSFLPQYCAASIPIPEEMPE